MKFGKLQNIDHVAFSLPSTPDATVEMLRSTGPRSGPLQFYIGATGWGMKEWVGRIYPPNTKNKDFLYHYTRQFNTIELNSTHYGIPKLATVEKWMEDATEDFRFCPKIPQSISHSRQLGMGQNRLAHFCDTLAVLNQKLGCCFLQFPPYFGLDRMPLVKSFLEQIPESLPLALEFRHQSWFEPGAGCEPLFAYMQEKGIGTVITDVAGRRDVLHGRLTTPTAMIRFVGNNLHPTDYQRIDEWVEKIKVWSDLGLREVYFFTHEPDNLLAPDLAMYLCERSSKMENTTVRGPKLIDPNNTVGRQISLFE